MKLSIGFSPCPNDTFIFDALVNGQLDTGDLQFEPVLEDVQTLNEWAQQGKLDITKLSFPAFFQALDKYILMDAGSALGKGVGPLLVAKDDKVYSNEDITSKEIALPGINTTANLLFSFAYPFATNKKYMRFDLIEDYVVATSALGVIIHENRFTYQDKGLNKVLDLGEYWETKMNSAIPLGGIAIKRSIDKAIQLKVESLIRQSLEHSFSHYPMITDYVKAHSQSMSEEVMRMHIDLYVNEHSLHLGDEGHKAIETLKEVFDSTQKPTANQQAALPLFLLS